MQTTVELIPLTLIDPNPYQPREREDAEHIQRLAASIGVDGMLQIPTARRVGERVQLAFGHSRLAAYWLLYTTQTQLERGETIDFEDESLLAQVVTQADLHLEHGEIFKAMPLSIRELTDEEMFRQAVRENVDRADLTAIEQARAMLRYRDEFGKTSAQIGALFGMSEAAVRNKMRLVELPEATQGLMAQGALGETTARKLLSLEKVVPGAADLVARELAVNGINTPAVVNERIERILRERGKQMYSARYSRQDGETPTGGAGLWPLDWTMEEIRELKFATFEKLYEGPKEASILYPHLMREGGETPTVYTIQKAFANLCVAAHAQIFGQVADLVSGRLAEQFPDALVLIRQLMRPPACTACPFYMRLDGVHYCMIESCWKNKKHAWLTQETERLSAELGIVVYDRDRDGNCEELYSKWVSSSKEAEEWFKTRADHLRLRAHYEEYGLNYLTDSAVVGLVSVRKEFQAKKAVEKAEEQHAKQNEQRKEDNQAASLRFLHECVIPAMAEQLLGSIAHAGGVILLGDAWRFRGIDLSNPTAPATLAAVKHELIDYQLRMELMYGVGTLGPVMVAKKLQEKLPTWGVKISGDLVQMARRYEAQPGGTVSIETAEQEVPAVNPSM